MSVYRPIIFVAKTNCWNFRSQYLQIEEYLEISQGDPADEILMTAKKLDSDIIIIGYKGYGKEGRFLLGSVTDKVVRHSSKSVLVVR